MAVQELVHFRAPQETLPESSLAFAIHEGFIRTPSKPLIVGSEKTFAYAESYQWMSVFAWHLRFVLGIDADSTVLVSLSNIVEFPLIIAALQMFGLRIALLSSTAEKMISNAQLTCSIPNWSSWETSGTANSCAR